VKKCWEALLLENGSYTHPTLTNVSNKTRLLMQKILNGEILTTSESRIINKNILSIKQNFLHRFVSSLLKTPLEMKLAEASFRYKNVSLNIKICKYMCGF